MSYENVIWSDKREEGIFNRHVIETRLITTRKVQQNNTSYNLADLDNIIVINSHHEARGQGMRIRGYGGVSYGMGSSKGNTVGDIAFICQGQPVIVFQQVPDPAGIVRLAKAAMKNAVKNPQVYNQPEIEYSEDSENKFIGGRLDDSQNPYDERPAFDISQDNKVCKCGNVNPANSSFCNRCGFALS